MPNCEATTGDLSKITSAEFWQGGSANDHPIPDMQNMLAFEGVSLGSLSKTLENSLQALKAWSPVLIFPAISPSKPLSQYGFTS